MATASMNPAPNATKCSMTARPGAARRVTASAPSRLPTAATSAYTRALDMGEQVLLRIAARGLEHLAEQALERLAHVGSRPHSRSDQVVPVHREVLQWPRILRGADGCHKPGGQGEGGRTGRGQGGQSVC